MHRRRLEALILSGAFFSAFLLADLSRTAQAEPMRPAITLTGEATRSVAPDTARFTVGIQRRGRDAAELQRAVNTDMTEVVAAIRAAATAGGIAEDRLVLRTEAIRVYETWTPAVNNQHQRINEASQQLSVEIRDLTAQDSEILGAMIAGAGANGANRVEGPFFDLRQRARHQAELRAEAASDARDKALAYLSVLGGSLGRVLSVTEQGDGGHPVLMARGMAAMAMDSAEMARPPVEVGQNDVAVRVTVTWEIVHPLEDL